MAKKGAKTRSSGALRIPGFNAEASLYITDREYRGADYSASRINGGIVQPQIICGRDSDSGAVICCNCDPYSGCTCGPVGRRTQM